MILIKNKVALKLLQLANDRKYSMTVCGVLLALEAVFLVAIIHKVPYTEIDWKAYMEQAALILGVSTTTVKLLVELVPWSTPEATLESSLLFTT